MGLRCRFNSPLAKGEKKNRKTGRNHPENCSDRLLFPKPGDIKGFKHSQLETRKELCCRVRCSAPTWSGAGGEAGSADELLEKQS